MKKDGQKRMYDGTWGRIDKPTYYSGEQVECITAMLQQFGNQHVAPWCILNAFKYLWRCMKKYEAPTEDLKKAQYYINKAIELYEKEDNKSVQAA